MKNDTARDSILGSIRQHLAASKPFDAVRNELHHHEMPGVVMSFEAESVPRESLIALFRENLEAVGANVSVVYDEPGAAAEVERIILLKGAREVAYSGHDEVRAVIGRISEVADFIEDADAGELFETDLGVTGAQWAIAETGTLVLENDRERNRLTSLVPPVHVCLLRASKIRQTLGEVLSSLNRGPSPAITFITGASRTSDIELTLAIGVHGPGELHVIVIDD